MEHCDRKMWWAVSYVVICPVAHVSEYCFYCGAILRAVQSRYHLVDLSLWNLPEICSPVSMNIEVEI
jgi:hypothetical protein